MPTFLVLTAIRIEVPPLDPEIARHTPEDGFIVDKVQAWVIQPGGQKSQIAVPLFCSGFGNESGKLQCLCRERSRKQKRKT